MIRIEFLYYNKESCSRCASTDESVQLSLRELKNAIKKSKIKIDFKEKKLPKSKIHLSPSILINGKDIEKLVNKKSKLKSNHCLDCCQLASKSVNCRTFIYNGKHYDYIPKEMILEAIKVALEKQGKK